MRKPRPGQPIRPATVLDGSPGDLAVAVGLPPPPTDDEIFEVAVALIRDVGSLMTPDQGGGPPLPMDLATDLNRALLESPRDALVATAAVASELAARLSDVTNTGYEEIIERTASEAKRSVRSDEAATAVADPDPS